MEKHFVTFFSPGTFLAEHTTKSIDSWSVDIAVTMASKVTERYSANPYAFQFSTRSRKDNGLDSTVIKSSAMYYLNGTIATLKDIERRNDPNEAILLANMRCNGWQRVVTSHTPYKWTQPLEDGDVVLQVSP